MYNITMWKITVPSLLTNFDVIWLKRLKLLFTFFTFLTTLIFLNPRLRNFNMRRITKEPYPKEWIVRILICKNTCPQKSVRIDRSSHYKCSPFCSKKWTISSTQTSIKFFWLFLMRILAILNSQSIFSFPSNTNTDPEHQMLTYCAFDDQAEIKKLLWFS